MINQVEKYLLELQKEICSEIEQIDGKSLFEIDKWARTDKRGDGVTVLLLMETSLKKVALTFQLYMVIKCLNLLLQQDLSLREGSILRLVFH